MARCRSCNAEIDWAKNAKTGKLAPIDRTTSDNGNIRVDHDGTYEVVTPGPGLRTSHFATCPGAGGHRKKPETAA